MTVKWAIFWVCILTLGWVSPSVANEVERLQQMVQAASQMNYKGKYRFSQGPDANHFWFVHINDQGQSLERIVPLEGQPLEVIRRGDQVTCLVPNAHNIALSALPSSPFSRLGATDFSTIMGHYRVRQVMMTSLLERQSTVIELVGKEQDRYGYRFWLDEQTQLLLKLETLSLSDEVLETIEFVEFKTGTEVGPADLEVELTGDIQSITETLPQMKLDKAKMTNWMPTWLPQGFKLVQSNRIMQGQGSRCSQMYSDGLASFSLFVDEGVKPMVYRTLKGASLAKMVDVEGVQVTLVGEIPEATADRILTSVMRMK